MAVLGAKKEESTLSQQPRMNPADAHTILGREAKFSGKLTFEGTVRIDGKFEGEIFTEDNLVVGPGAEVKAKLNVGMVVINGSVEGDVVAKAAVEIKAPGRLKGNIVTPTLVIDKGVLFDGTCKMSQEERKGPPTPAPAPAKS